MLLIKKRYIFLPVIFLLGFLEIHIMNGICSSLPSIPLNEVPGAEFSGLQYEKILFDNPVVIGGDLGDNQWDLGIINFDNSLIGKNMKLEVNCGSPGLEVNSDLVVNVFKKTYGDSGDVIPVFITQIVTNSSDPQQVLINFGDADGALVQAIHLDTDGKKTTYSVSIVIE